MGALFLEYLDYRVNLLTLLAYSVKKEWIVFKVRLVLNSSCWPSSFDLYSLSWLVINLKPLGSESHKTYFTQYVHYVEKINDCLYKPFQVDAAVLKLTPLVKPKIRVEYCVLETVVKALFQYRRKYIRKGARFIVLHIPIYLSILHRLISIQATHAAGYEQI